MRYWLMKTEPTVYSFADLKKMPGKRDHWDGIRNYQARNFIRDDMKKGDQVLFYHSNTKEPSVVGLAEIVKEAYPDHTAFDSKQKYFDPKSDPENPRWFMVDLKWKADFKNPVTLNEIRDNPALKNMLLIRRGMRLSIQPVSEAEFNEICRMGGL